MSIANHGQLQLKEHCTSGDCDHRNVYTQSEQMCLIVGMSLIVPFFQQDVVVTNDVEDCWRSDCQTHYI